MHFSSSTNTQTCEGWINIPTRLSAEKIVSRFSARFFLGHELSMPFIFVGWASILKKKTLLASNAKFLEAMEQYAVHVLKDGPALSILPKWLRP